MKFGAFVFLPLCIAGLASSGGLEAGPVFRLTPENLVGAYIGRSIEYHADLESGLRLAEVQGDQVKFFPLPEDAPHFGFGNHASYWFRLTVENPDERAHREWILDVDYVFLDQVVFYRPAAQRPGAYEQISTGDRRPFVEREIEHRSFAFRVRTPPGVNVYNLRLYNPAQARFPVRAWSPTTFTTHRLSEWMSTAFIFGGLLILFLSNLLLFGTVRKPAYLYLLVFIPGLALLYLLISGFGFQYFWPRHPALNQSMITVVPIMALGFVGYLRHLLETPILVPRLDRILLILLGICAGFAVLNLFVPYARLAAIAAVAAVPVLGLLIL
ncbi:MAG: 7TM-DISM domain-containing protein, partial [Leptospirales bacterium]